MSFFTGILLTFFAFVALVSAGVHYDMKTKADYAARCARAGMSYGHQSTGGKVPTAFDFCIAADGTVKVIP